MAVFAATDRADAADRGPAVAWDEGSVEYWQQFGREVQKTQEQEAERRSSIASTDASEEDDPSVPTWQPPAGGMWGGWWPQDVGDDSPRSWFWYWDGEAWYQRPSPARRETLGGLASLALLDWYDRWATSARLDRRELAAAHHELLDYLPPLTFRAATDSWGRPCFDGDWKDGVLFVPTVRAWEMLMRRHLHRWSWWQRFRLRRFMFGR